MPTQNAYDTLGQTVKDNDIAASDGGTIAFSFTSTVEAGAALSDVQLSLEDAMPTDGGSVTVALYSDSSTAPGILVATLGTILDSTLSSSGPAVVDIPVSVGVSLSAGARYWIEVTGSSGSGVLFDYDNGASGAGASDEFYFERGGVGADSIGGAFLARVVEGRGTAGGAGGNGGGAGGTAANPTGGSGTGNQGGGGGGPGGGSGGAGGPGNGGDPGTYISVGQGGTGGIGGANGSTTPALPTAASNGSNGQVGEAGEADFSNVGGTGGGGGGGGAGGTGAIASSNNSTLSVNVTGGAGGGGGTGGEGPGAGGGSGGGGGGGGGGLAYGGTSVGINAGAKVQGGGGGTGGTGGQGLSENGGRGGNGGDGGDGVDLTGAGATTLTNAGMITGGNGATGGTGGEGGNVGGDGGDAGDGGDGLDVDGGVATTITNSGTISGGAAGAHGQGGRGSHAYGGNGGLGAEGAGIVGANLTITNTGTIAGGGTTGDAIHFTGGANMLKPNAGTLTGALDIDGAATTLTIDTAAVEADLSNAIIGTGSLTALTDSTSMVEGDLILTGVETYSGSTTVQGSATAAELLELQGSILNSKTIKVGAKGQLFIEANDVLATTAAVALTSSSGVLTFDNSAQIGALSGTAGTVTLAAGIVLTTGTNNGTDAFGGIIKDSGSAGGSLTKTGSGTFTLSGTNSYVGVTTVTAGILDIQNASALGAATAGTTVKSGATLKIEGDGLTIAEPLTLVGTGVGGTGALQNVDNAGSNGNTLIGAITLTGTTRIDDDSGQGLLIVNGTISGTNTKLTLGGTGYEAIGAIATGTGSLTKDGTGTVSLTGDNSYTGLTTVSAGLLQLDGSGNAIADTGAVSVSAAGTLEMLSQETIGSIAGSGHLKLDGTLTVGVNAATSTTFSGLIVDETSLQHGSLTKTGTSTLILSGASTYSGGTTISAGTLELLNASTTAATAALGTGGVSVASGAVLDVRSADANEGQFAVASAISGAGALLFDGPNAAFASLNADTYSGGTTIKSGIVELNDNTALGSGPVTMTGGAIRAINDGRTLANSFRLGGVIGLGAATNIAGTVTLTANTTVTPCHNAGNSAWLGAVALGAFTLATSDTGPNVTGGSWAGQTFTISGVISGSGGVTQNDAGTLILSGADTYAGATRVTAGTLDLQNARALGTASGGTLSLSGAATVLKTDANLSYAGTVGATAGTTLNLTGGYLLLSGNATFSGATITGSQRLYAEGASTTISGGLTVGGTAVFENTKTTRQTKGAVTVGDTSSNAAILLNYTGGTYAILDDSGIAHGASTASYILNQGLFEKTGGTATSTVAASFVDTGSVAVAGGGTLAFAGPSNSFAGSIGGQGAIVLSGGATTLKAGTAVNVSSFAIAGSSTTVMLAENLTYAGNFSLGAGARFTIASGDTLTLKGGPSFVTATLGGTGSLAVASGQVTLNSGAALTTAAVSLSGSGASLTEGTSLSYAGTFTQGAGTTLSLTGGYLLLAGTTSLAGAVAGSQRLYAEGASTTLSSLTIGGTAVVETTKAVTQAGGTVTVGDTSSSVAVLYTYGGSVYAITDNSSIARGTAAGSYILDQGTIRKTGGTGTSTIAPNIVNNASAAGAVGVTSGTLDLGGTLTGNLNLTVGAGATLILEKSAAASAAASFTGSNATLQLNDAQDDHGTVAGFAAGETLDLRSIGFGAGTTTTLGYSGTTGPGTLTVSDGTHTASLAMIGNYSKSSFHLGTDSHGGAAVTFV